MFEHESKHKNEGGQGVPKGYSPIKLEDIDFDSSPEIYLNIDGVPVLYTKEAKDLENIDLELLEGKLLVRTPERPSGKYRSKEEMIQDVQNAIKGIINKNS